MEGCMLSCRGQKCIKALIACERWCVGNSCLHDSASRARKLVHPANDCPIGVGCIENT